METLSFILGIAFVVVIALTVVATYAFVKVLKIKEITRNTDQMFADVWQGIAEENRQINQRVDLLEKEIFSQLDSRLDKLENKLIIKK